MTRFLLDTGIAGLYLAKTRGVLERAQAETAKGNRIGIAGPVLGQLAIRRLTKPRLSEIHRGNV
jgi:tRNA(fMet)-specific endonuclease VapC